MRAVGERRELRDRLEIGTVAEVRDQVAVEITGNTRLFHGAVATHVKRVVSVNPNRLQVVTRW